MALGSRRLRLFLGLSVALSLGGAGCVVEVPPPPMPPPAPGAAPQRSTADIVAASLPGIVLLINERPGKDGGKPVTTFGAGFLTRDDLVVTSLHVVDGDGKLSAMLYKPGRASYTPMDGGLSRFLFENQADLVPAERIAADGVTDLAVLRVAADTSHLPRLAWSSEEVRPGDRVLALGHPQETVWSFSEGVVGALQHGIVQHDAIVGPGSSGGPLLDAKGAVVGVNIARVVNQPSGLSFARPIAIVASTFSDRKVASPLDLSTPASAALACWRAQQLALSDTADCFDWEREWELWKQVVEEARRVATSADARARIDSCLLGPHTRSVWLARSRDHAVHMFDPDFQKSKQGKKVEEELLQGTESGGAGGAKDAKDGDEAARSADSSFVTDYLDPSKLAQRLRNGLRVDGTHVFGKGNLAWVLLASRGGDGSVSQFTELYSLVGGKWLQRTLPVADELAELPKTWPVPVMTFAWKRPRQLSSVLEDAASTAPCPFGPPDADAASSPGGSGRAVLRAGFATDH